MPSIETKEALRSVFAQKRFSVPRRFGCAIFGRSHYSDDDLFIEYSYFGGCFLGENLFGDYVLLSGIYQIRHGSDGPYLCRENFMVPKNPRSIPQQANRSTFADAISAWQALTNEQKAFYNEKAVGQHLSGYNLFIKGYMLSN